MQWFSFLSPLIVTVWSVQFCFIFFLGRYFFGVCSIPMRFINMLFDAGSAAKLLPPFVRVRTISAVRRAAELCMRCDDEGDGQGQAGQGFRKGLPPAQRRLYTCHIGRPRFPPSSGTRSSLLQY